MNDDKNNSEEVKYSMGRLLGSVAMILAVVGKGSGWYDNIFGKEAHLTLAKFGEAYGFTLILLLAGIVLAFIGNILYGVLEDHIFSKTRFTNNALVKSLIVGLATLGIIYVFYIWWP